MFEYKFLGGNNMKLVVSTTQMTITSKVTKEMYDKAMDFAPEALVVTDEDCNQVYKLGFDENVAKGAISTFGATMTSVEEDKLALTIVFPKQYASQAKAVAGVKKAHGNAVAALANMEDIIIANIKENVEAVDTIFAELEA